MAEKSLESILASIKKSKISACVYKGETKHYRITYYDVKADAYRRYDFPFTAAGIYGTKIMELVAAGKIEQLPLTIVKRKYLTQDEMNGTLVGYIDNEEKLAPYIEKVIAAMVCDE